MRGKSSYHRVTSICLAVFVSLILPLTAFADEITFDFETKPSVKKTVRWSLEGGADEYRFLAGGGNEEDYSQAKKAGGGREASATITENGNYTLYAKKGEDIYYVQIPVTTVDHTPPQINITDIVSTADNLVSVYYDIEDYYGVEEVRYMKGQASKSDYASASVVHGGVIADISNGTYTVFAKDLAGNISVYTMTVKSDYSESQSSSEYQTESSAHESTEWAKTDLWVEPRPTQPTTPAETEPPPTESTPETTSPAETEPPPETTAPPDRPENPGKETPTEPEGGPPPQTIPVNPTVPSVPPPVERFPQTGSLKTERMANAVFLSGIAAIGTVLILIGRRRKTHSGEEEGKDHDDSQS